MISTPVHAASGISSITRETVRSGAAGSDNRTQGSFTDLVHEGMQQTRGMESQAQSAVMDLLRGNGGEVHSAMIATQQAELAFELALQVRNKAVAAYQQMMQMQF